MKDKIDNEVTPVPDNTEKIMWTKSDYQSYFFNSDGNIWLEKEDNGLICATFEEVKRKGDEVILYDKSRLMFVKLTGSKALRGKIEIKIDQEFADGWWIKNEKDLSAIAIELAWKKEDSNEHFYKSKDEIWHEKKDGLIVRSLTQVSKGRFDVTLYDDKSHVFVKLTPKDALKGTKWNQIDENICKGTWMEIF